VRLIRSLAQYNVIALFALVGAAGGAFTANAQNTQLDPLVGRDLWKDRLPEGTQSRLDLIVGKVPKGVMMEPAPWHVWKTNRNGVIRFVVLLGAPEVIVPGGSSACVVLLDGGLHRINNWCFQTGWRIDPDSALFDFSSDLASDVIVLNMIRFINGRNVAREYFALSGDRLRFVRMENDKGEAVQNEYVFPNFEIGIVPTGETEEEWIDMLRSADKPNVLSALVFLSGRHITEAQRRFAPEPSESKYASLFQKLISNARIRELIAGLAHSENEWIRQAAQLASRGPRERLFQ
jgi:hypothetical protein